MMQEGAITSLALCMTHIAEHVYTAHEQ